jgi:cytochrome b
VRLFHWALAATVATAWLVAGEAKQLHELAGYAAGVLIVSRLIAGFAGSRYTRFVQFVRGPRTVLGYFRDVVCNRERRHLVHNPAGGAMVLTLLACVGGAAVTGWMQSTDTFWGVEWVETTHKVLGNGILVLVAVHVAGVVLASVRHGENLVWAMLSGRKRAPAPGDVV